MRGAKREEKEKEKDRVGEKTESGRYEGTGYQSLLWREKSESVVSE